VFTVPTAPYLVLLFKRIILVAQRGVVINRGLDHHLKALLIVLMKKEQQNYLIAV